MVLVDRYILRLVLWPMAACLAATLVALLLSRALTLLNVLSPTNAGLGRVVQLTTSLIPHFMGLALPVAFFVALFIVVTQLDDASEIAALLAGGVSLTRIAAPLVALGVVLMAVSLIVFGYLQPYSRYAYRVVFHAAVTTGWNGRLSGGAFVSEGGDVITADGANLQGDTLQHVFIRRGRPGGEEVISAGAGQLIRRGDGRAVTMVMRDGVQIHENAAGAISVVRFHTLILQMTLAEAAAMPRARGGDQRELTLGELVRLAAAPRSYLPRAALLAELYARLARCAVLPFMPLLALPLGMASKRGRRAAGLVLAGALLLSFQYGLQFGEGLAQARRVAPGVGVGAPFLLFTGFCVWIFGASRRRPGETPIAALVQTVDTALRRVRRRA